MSVLKTRQTIHFFSSTILSTGHIKKEQYGGKFLFSWRYKQTEILMLIGQRKTTFFNRNAFIHPLLQYFRLGYKFVCTFLYILRHIKNLSDVAEVEKQEV